MDFKEGEPEVQKNAYFQVLRLQNLTGFKTCIMMCDT